MSRRNSLDQSSVKRRELLQHFVTPELRQLARGILQSTSTTPLSKLPLTSTSQSPGRSFRNSPAVADPSTKSRAQKYRDRRRAQQQRQQPQPRPRPQPSARTTPRNQHKQRHTQAQAPAITPPPPGRLPTKVAAAAFNASQNRRRLADTRPPVRKQRPTLSKSSSSKPSTTTTTTTTTTATGPTPSLQVVIAC